MRFPKIIKHRQVVVKIYGKSQGYQSYRVVCSVDGKRRMRSFATYSAAKAEAERLAKEISEGSPAAALTASQARDALTALQRLQELYVHTGKRVSLLSAVSEFSEATARLKDRPLAQAVEAYLASAATVKRKEIGEAVEEYVAGRKPLTEEKNGKRAQLSKGHAGLVASFLKRFAATFPHSSVCDLAKEHLTLYMQTHDQKSPKTRNHVRGAIKQFFKWCVKSDYLPQPHRLLDAVGMATEQADAPEVEYYRPEELKLLLDTARTNPAYHELLPVIALGGLAGIRLAETLRLEWENVWRVKGHVEIKASKAKTRSRRLVEICPALADWLEPFRGRSGPVYGKSNDTFYATFGCLRDSLKIQNRDNGLRHAFCTYHYALHSDENLTARLAGNSPSMVHAHYKALVTTDEAQRWFVVTPSAQQEVR